MTKPVEEMTLEELRAERVALGTADEAPDPDETTPIPDPDEEKPAPWPHDHMMYGDLELEVRKPNESALVAISMSNVPVLGAQGQMRIFTQFLTGHLSPSSFTTVVSAMADPESGIDINGLISKLSELTTKGADTNPSK